MPWQLLSLNNSLLYIILFPTNSLYGLCSQLCVLTLNEEAASASEQKIPAQSEALIAELHSANQLFLYPTWPL